MKKYVMTILFFCLILTGIITSNVSGSEIYRPYGYAKDGGFDVVQPGSKAIYSIIVRNDGTTNDTYKIEIVQSNETPSNTEGFTFKIEPEQLKCEPNETATVVVTVKGPKGDTFSNIGKSKITLIPINIISMKSDINESYTVYIVYFEQETYSVYGSIICAVLHNS
jgi:hypothetical protein